ncbi:Uncharacterised protein [Prevotella melaninogenica]|nr:Uncharacterised protein [Prevotella melaninogenica]
MLYGKQISYMLVVSGLFHKVMSFILSFSFAILGLVKPCFVGKHQWC